MKQTLFQLPTTQRYRNLLEAFYSDVTAQGIENPRLVVASEDCCDWLGLDSDTLGQSEGLALLAGLDQPDHWRPLAMKYFGHQFGYLNPDLGDGRGLLMAEVSASNGDIVDLHLKGAGLTPYSRDGDGRAVLRSSIREFLGSEALHALGIPSTRALCVVDSDTNVMREQMESAATLMRVSRTHIRFGHFEFARHNGGENDLQILCDYTCKHYFPELAGLPTQNGDMFKAVCERTADTIAKWQLFGFAHGVMNTDNMSIIGETFDYGPYGFLDTFEPGFICNHSDHQGRYAFNRQPAIAHWNLSVLAHALSPVTDKDGLNEGLHAFNRVFNDTFLEGMADKLGFDQTLPEDQTFFIDTFDMLSKCRLDYSWFFRTLSEHEDSQHSHNLIREQALDITGYDHWAKTYSQRLKANTSSAIYRISKMQLVNPKYILRNHLAQIAIEKAQQGDYSEVNRLHGLLRKPFSEQEGCEEYSALPPDWAKKISISCSS